MPSAWANPEGGVVSAGSANIITAPNAVDIHQQSDRVVIDWRSFDIAPHERTEFHQPSSSAIALNRIHSSQASQINGTLKANGNVILINQNGVAFGQNAQVDVNGLVASSSDIDNDRFLNDPTPRLNKPGSPTAIIINRGQIRAKDAGLVGFVAPEVENSGVIQARLGRVSLASGDSATVDFYGDGLLEVAVSEQAEKQLVRNLGTIEADGGVITLSAAAGSRLLASAIEVGGNVRAQTVEQRGGEIIISGSGRHAVQGNNPQLKNTSPTVSRVTVAGNLDASGRGAQQKGGRITVTGDEVAVLQPAVLNADGKAGGGIIRVGGEYLGQGTTPVARNVSVAQGSRLSASATEQGDGGEVIVFAEDTANFDGLITANAAGVNSHGGFVETSGKAFLNIGTGSVQALATGSGNAGTWLLDPADITITAATNANITGATPYTATATGSQLSAATIVGVLNAGTNVTVMTTNDAFVGNGDIFVNAPITTTGTGALTLSAFRNIEVTSAITLNGGALSLRSNNTGAAGGGAIRTTAAIATNGGNVTMSGGSAVPTIATYNANGSVNVAATGYAQGINLAGFYAGVNIGANINAGGTASGGNIIIHGRGENGTNASHGIDFTAGTISTNFAGTIDMSGIGQGTAGNANQVHGAAIRSLISTANGALRINGISGGGTGTTNVGVLLSSTGGIARTTGTGAITLSGTAGANTSIAYGVLVNFLNGINPTGTGAVTVFGSGGAGTSGQKVGIGINASGGTGSLVANGGAVAVTGLGGTASTANNNHGIALAGGGAGVGVLSNTGTGTITLTGTGGGAAGSNNNHGVFITGANASVTSSGSGLITINGTGGNGTGGTNHGVYSNIADGIRNSGTGSITVNGTAGGTSGFGFITNVANGVRTNAAASNITLSSNTFSLNLANNINGAGTVTIAPRTAITMGVGTGAQALQFTDAEIGRLTAGTGYIFGSTTATSLTANTAFNFAGRALTYVSGGNIDLNSTLDGALTSFTTTAATGTTTVAAAIGGTTAVGPITMTGRDLAVNANMRSSGAISAAFSRDITVANTGRTITTGAGAGLTMTAAGNNVAGTGNLTLNDATLSVGTGALNLTSGVNVTRPSWTATTTNLVRLGATFGAVTIQGFLDTFINRDINSAGSLTVLGFRDVTLNAANTLTGGGANAVILRAANGNAANTGTLNLNGNVSVGLGGLTLLSGQTGGVRPNYTATTTNLVRSGATFGPVDIQGFGDFTLNRLLNSTGTVGFSNNTRTILNNNVTSTAGAISFLNPVALAEAASATVSTTNQNITFNSTITDTAGGAAESLTVNPGTALATFNGAVDGVGLALTAGTANLNAAMGATTALGNTTISTANSLTLANSIRASALNIQTTGAGSFVAANSSLETTGAGGALTVAANGVLMKNGTSNIVSNNGAITLTSGTFNLLGGGYNILSNGGAVNLTGPSGIYTGGTLGIATSNGNLNINSPLHIGGPFTATLGTGTLTLASTVNAIANLFSSPVNVLVVGGGGGGGGRDGAFGAGGGSGGAVDTGFNALAGQIYTILVGGGGGGGGNMLSLAAGGAGGANGGGSGGIAGASGLSGGGGGGGGASSIYAGSTAIAVGGGGAGGGGSNEGTANDVNAPGGGSQPNGNTGVVAGSAGANFIGDGGGGGGGGGGFFGGNGQTNLLTSGQASGGANYANAGNIFSTITNGNDGLRQALGSTPGAAVSIAAPRATFYNYAGNGAGGTAVTNSAPGSNGIVVIRYTGTASQIINVGGTVTTSGADTLVTYTNTSQLNLFSPLAGCVGNCDFTATAGSVTYGGAIGGVTPLNNVSITTTNSQSLPSIAAATILARTTGATADLTISPSAVLTASGAGNALTLAAGRNFINSSGAGALNLTGAGRYLVYSTNPANDTSGGLTNDFRRFSCSFNASGTCAFNATVNQTVTMPGTTNGFLYSTTPLITVTPSAIASFVYGTATPSLTGYAYNTITSGQYLTAGDFTADTITGSINGITSYAPGPVNGNVGSYNIDYSSGNLFSALGYGFTYANNASAITVTQRPLTVSLIGGITKVYDGNDGATLAGANYSIANIFNSEALSITNTSGTYDNKNVGTAKNVSVTGLTLAGATSGNYSLTSTTASGNIGEITQRALTVTATGSNKVYDANDVAGITLGDNRILGDVLTLTFGSALFNNKNVGTAKPINVTGINVTGTDAGNYSFNTTTSTNADITQRALTVSATGISRTFDGTTNATVTLSDNRILGDVLSLSFASANFSSSAVGTAIPISVSGISLSGLDAGNYSFNTTASAFADILASPIAPVTSTSLPNTFTMVSQESGISNVSQPDDATSSTPRFGSTLVHLPKSAPQSNILRNRPVGRTMDRGEKAPSKKGLGMWVMNFRTAPPTSAPRTGRTSVSPATPQAPGECDRTDQPSLCAV